MAACPACGYEARSHRCRGNVALDGVAMSGDVHVERRRARAQGMVVHGGVRWRTTSRSFAPQAIIPV